MTFRCPLWTVNVYNDKTIKFQNNFNKPRPTKRNNAILPIHAVLPDPDEK